MNVVAGMLQAAKRPALARKVKTLARQSARRRLAAADADILIPLLSPQAAAVPSEQPQ